MGASRKPRSLKGWLKADLAGTLRPDLPKEPSRCSLLHGRCGIQTDMLCARTDIPALGVRRGQLVAYISSARLVVVAGRGELPHGAARSLLKAIQAGSLRPAILTSFDEAVAGRWDWDGLLADMGPQRALAAWREALSVLVGEFLQARRK